MFTLIVRHNGRDIKTTTDTRESAEALYDALTRIFFRVELWKGASRLSVYTVLF